LGIDRIVQQLEVDAVSAAVNERGLQPFTGTFHDLEIQALLCLFN